MLATNIFVREFSIDCSKVENGAKYPFALPLLQGFSRMALHPKLTFFVGENGSGKSTLLRALAVGLGFNPQGGSLNFKKEMTDEVRELLQAVTITRGVKRPKDGFYYRADSFFNVVFEIDRLGVGDAYAERSLHERSHGERFMDLVSNRLRGQGLYLFDEPEAALSPGRQLAFLAHVHALVERGAQVIVATHSPIIMAYPESKIYSLEGAHVSEKQYEETEHFQVYDSFMKRRPQMLRELLSE